MLAAGTTEVNRLPAAESCGTPVLCPSAAIISPTTSPSACVTPIPERERIKRQHGCAALSLLAEDHPIQIASVGDRPPRTIFARQLTDIIEASLPGIACLDSR